MRLDHPKKPCAECPWRVDVEPGQFEPERFAALAVCDEDMSRRVFQCHKTRDGKPQVCAGFLLRGAVHNLTIRLALREGEVDLTQVSDGGYPLHGGYFEMAVANGLEPDDPSLESCRSRPR